MRFVLTCGGTGGHIYPAIAIADKIKQHDSDAEILFIGTKKGMENTLVPKAGYAIKGIDAMGIDRRNPFNNIKTLKCYLNGSREVKNILKEFKPDCAIGTGGFVTGSVISQAHKLGIRCCIHEQNAIPGVANKTLSRFVDKVFVSFPGTEKYFKHPERAMLTGNPIRKGFMTLDRAECRKALGLSDSDRMVLVFGGSLGAEVLNRETLGLVDSIGGSDIKLYFVTGRRYYEQIKAAVDAMECDKSNLKLIDYADNMPELMSASDIVVSRAGAIALSEIAACGKPSVLVPSPNVTNNHQFHNAKALENVGAAVLVEEKDLPEGKNVLAGKLRELAGDDERLAQMAANAKAFGRTDAADIIYDNLGL